MGRWWAISLMAVLAVLALAGCSGKSPSPGGAAAIPDAREVEDVHVDPASKLGAIAGVVVDEAVRPIAGATVDLLAKGTNVTTGKDGTFSFKDLDPGAYFMAVSAPAFFAVQTSATVEAGAVADVLVALPTDTTPQPYHTTLSFRGHIDAHAGSASLVFQNYAPGIVQCTCEFTFSTDPDAVTFVVDATGSVQVAAPDPVQSQGYHSVYWEVHGDPGGPDQEDNVYRYADFPFTGQVERSDFLNTTNTWMVRVTGGAWVSGQMDYDLFITVFYRTAAPESWSLLNGDV